MSNLERPESRLYSREYVASYYDGYGEKEWDRFSASPPNRINLAIHTHYLNEYLTGGTRVLEIGAGPGRFTRVLSEMGCQIVVADVSPVQLDLNREYAKRFGFEASVERRELLDVCDLTIFEANSFDYVICYGGPLSYVFDRASEAMAECVRVCRRGGRVLVSVMSLWGSCHRFLTEVIKLPVESNRKIIESGNLIPENLEGATHRCHMFRSKELRKLAEDTALRVLAMSASNFLSLVHDEFLEDFSEDSTEWTELVRTEILACAEPGCLDSGTHIILVGEKE